MCKHHVLAPGTKPADNRAMRLRPIHFAAAFGLASLTSCLSWTNPRPDFDWDRSPDGVSLSTSPPGANVIIDGFDSGFATPCIIAFDESESYRVEFELHGYRTAGLYLTPNRTWELVPYIDSGRAPRVWNFPMWLPLGEFLIPVRTNTALAPSRVHLRLRLGGEDFQTPASAVEEGQPGY